MKTANYYIAIAILILLFVIAATAKQPPADLGYDPPAGWEFVMKLDSVSKVFIYSYNDSCFIYAEFAGGKPLIYDLTTDGGETWNKIPIMPIPYITFIKNTMNLHYVTLNGSNFNYIKSTDFFKTSEKYFICKSPYPEDILYQSPIDPNILIATFKATYSEEDLWTGKLTWYGNMNAYISRDGGKTWEVLSNLYRHPKYLTLYKFNFDWAEKGHWFVNATDGDDIDGTFTPASPPVNLETFDDGKTFREIKFDPSNYPGNYSIQFGLDGKQNLRESYYYDARGILISKYNDSLINGEFYDWLFIIDPTKPKSNWDSGYARAINEMYQFDFMNYSNIFTPIYEYKKDIKNNKETVEDYLYYSINNGVTWELLNYFDKLPYYVSSFLDQGTKTLWIYIKDEEWQIKKSGNRYKGSLWKLKLNWESTSIENIENKDGVNIFPNPARDYLEISSFNPTLKRGVDEGSDIQIFDMLGVVVSTPSLRDTPQRGELRIDVSYLVPGTYFLKINSNKNVIVKKFMVIR